MKIQHLKRYFKEYGILLIIIITISLIYFYFTDHKLQTGYQIFSVSLLLFGVISSSLNFSDTSEKNIHFKQSERSEKLAELYDGANLIKAREFTREHKENHCVMPNDELLTRIAYDRELKSSIIHTFNFWEKVSLSIKYETANEEYLRLFFKDVYLAQYARFKAWIDDECKNDNRNGYNSLQFLYEKWKDIDK